MTIKDTSPCEREPIHIPGAIQPFGVLFSLDPETWSVLQVSGNVKTELGLATSRVLGQRLPDLLTEKCARQLTLKKDLSAANPYKLNFKKSAKVTWQGFFHHFKNQLILEIEPGSEGDLDRFYQLVTGSISAVQSAATVAQLCQIAASEAQRISGFDRVMIYRFDPEWNGKVVAEALAAPAAAARSEIESYNGHHFPASDIPPQARAVFLNNWLRAIPDVHYQPVPIEPLLNPSHSPLDLGRSFLRSVSPVHIQYLKNMNVAATLTVSLIRDGQLWGLIACHHKRPYLPALQVRAACRFLGKLVSSQLGLKENQEDAQFRRRLKSTHRALCRQMEQEEDLIRGLVKYSPTLLDLTNAEGAAAAIYFEDEWTLIGQTPTIPQIEELTTWLAEQDSKDVYWTDSLPVLYPPALAYKHVCSGLLAISIPKRPRNYIFWFKPEVIQTVTWAGDPRKNIERLPDQSLKIEPRASFEAWKEKVALRSRPWKPLEIQAAMRLRTSILGLDLKRQFQREQQARTRAERISREKEDLINAVSHDLKTPVTAFRLALDLMDRELARIGSTSLRELLANLRRPLQHMHRLIHDLLDIAKIEAGQFVVDGSEQDVSPLLKEVYLLYSPIAKEKSVRLECQLPQQECRARCEEGRLIQVLSNLVGNAIKFTPSGGTVRLGLEPADNVFFVEDTGCGIPQDHLPHLFDRFWQAKETKRMGTGLGLAIASGIVQAHGGRLWVESEVGRGTRISFVIPSSATS